ncbi:hypothetical protein LCGC14_0225450 [marine sediment metagenome]|uniref:Uncharacterized protein n=1 Tax=marine sediment metagenome TaxID=412755 RepID=A0A0F9WX36_9ZZZZ
MEVIHLYTDAGHGWAKVLISRLKELGIEKNISQYSYMKDKFAYLEEDCDLSTYCDKLKELGISFQFIEEEYVDKSIIRSYRHFGI